MPVRPPARLLRASVFAAVCVSLTLIGHSAASGATDARAAVLTAAIGWAGTTAVAWVLSGHERSLPTILGGLLGGQFGLHVLFSAVQADQGPPAAAHAVHVGQAAGTSGPRMTLAHLLAAVAAAWWLRRGERLAWSLARRLAAFALAALPAPPEPLPVPDRRLPPHPDTPSRPRRTEIRHSVVLRGPPLVRCA
ncbi:hypothetical protein [Thermomonospora catenispora]|uniref:hypothetical protein n=1 Tax=Thermomonospora catenispora TaxID=2493090 RepID=UPI001120A971|nr:hypothetical protein [Thermomonospora catenispora]TNY35844.1 hypothetical protein EIO00_16265 [Thermomonospora catenispora]